MYANFTDRARKVMQLANQEAQRFNHEYIGTEHILLGLIKEGSGTAINVLKNLDIDLRLLLWEVERVVPSGPETWSGKLPQTPRTKKVIEYAIEESRFHGHNYVGTEHLLLGLVREEEGVAAQVLTSLGVKLEDVREEVEALLGTAVRDRAGADLEVESPIAQELRTCAEHDLYLPLRYNDGTAIEPEKLDRIKKHLTECFGGLTCFPQKNEGTWKVGNVTFREEIVILRVLAETESLGFFLRLKEELQTDLRQEEILIVTRRVRVL